MLREQAAFPEELSGLVGTFRGRKALRLYASLNATQQQALWQGNAIPVTQMLPTQRALYLNAVRELPRPGSAAPDLRQWPSGRLALRSVPLVRIREQRSGGTSERIEVVTPSRSGHTGAAAVESPGAAVLELPPLEAAAVARAAAASSPSSAPPAVTAGPGTPTAGPASGMVTRFPCMNLLFKWEYSPTAQDFSLVTIAAPP
jgi:hypothetical protein